MSIRIYALLRHLQHAGDMYAIHLKIYKANCLLVCLDFLPISCSLS